MGKTDINPFENPSIWDSFALIGTKGRVVLPGSVKVNVTTGADLDSAKVAGEDGTIDVFRGYQAAEITLVINVMTADEYKRLKGALEIYRPRKKVAPVAVDAVHPQLELHGIKQVFVTAISSGQYSPRDGFTIQMTLKEFINRPKKAAVTKPIAAKPATRVSANGAPDANGAPEGNDWAAPVPKAPSVTPPKPGGN